METLFAGSRLSIQAVLKQASDALRQLSASPRLDAELLLGTVLDCERSFLYAHPELSLDDQQREHYLSLIARRAAGEPVAYIRGVKEFWSLPLRVTADVLVPRPETELLVELALECVPAHTHLRVLDLGTGSGAIALAIAHERPGWEITATDIDVATLEVARANAERLGIGNITFVSSDWFQALSAQGFDLIVSNPPYLAASDPHLQVLELKQEPERVLVSGENGTQALETIIRGATRHLPTGGYLIVEHGYDQGTAVRRLFQSHRFHNVHTYKDLAGHERASLGACRT